MCFSQQVQVIQKDTRVLISFMEFAIVRAVTYLDKLLILVRNEIRTGLALALAARVRRHVEPLCKLRIAHLGGVHEERAMFA